jgi:cytidylate kinase
MAGKKGLTLVEYLKLGENDPSIDKEVDDYLISLSQKEKNFIIESRTAWHLLPKSLNIYLKVTKVEGARRVFEELKHKNSRNEIKEAASLKKVLKKIQERRETDDKRYLKYYGINIRDEKKYDFILDTTSLSIDDVFRKTSDFITKHQDISV